MKKIVLIDSLPDFAHELEHLLLKENRPELACQVESMQVDMDRCVSGEECCAMLCTGLQPSKGWGVGQTTIVLTPERGNILVDVVDGDIIAVEIFFRIDVQERLLQVRHALEQSSNGSEREPCGTASVVMCHGNG